MQFLNIFSDKDHGLGLELRQFLFRFLVGLLGISNRLIILSIIYKKNAQIENNAL